MKALIKKDDIFPILFQVQSLLEKKSTLPIYMNILMQSESKDHVKIYASDSELSFSADCKGQIEEEGSLVVNGKKSI